MLIYKADIINMNIKVIPVFTERTELSLYNHFDWKYTTVEGREENGK